MTARVTFGLEKENRRIVPALIWLLGIFAGLYPNASAQVSQRDADTDVVELTLELASDFASADPAMRARVLNLIDRQDDLSSKEVTLANVMFQLDPDQHYRSVAAAQSAEALDYLRALQVSYSRYKAAQAAGDNEWSAKQLKAAQEYAALAANALTAEAKSNDADVERLRGSPFALRRSTEQQAEFAEVIKARGLSAEHRKLLQDTGYAEADIQELQKQLLEKPPEQMGRSATEWLSDISATRHDLASQLNAFAQANPGGVTGLNTQAFDVGNPHDRKETIDLYIRPISIPPDWKLSIMDAEEQAKFKVREVDPGKHYAVTLPAKGQMKVASAVVPVGEVGTNTTARWAVEGKIGNELIGGMVHEMNVPYIIADLQLLPVGSKEVEEELPAPSRNWARVAAEVAATIVVLGLLAYFFIFWRRGARGSATP